VHDAAPDRRAVEIVLSRELVDALALSISAFAP
jgi:hypothetical protein